MKTEQIPYVGDKDLPLAGDVIIPDEKAKAELVARLFGPEAVRRPRRAKLWMRSPPRTST